jgi:PGF-pre-PGF domain-containing protein
MKINPERIYLHLVLVILAIHVVLCKLNSYTKPILKNYCIHFRWRKSFFNSGTWNSLCVLFLLILLLVSSISSASAETLKDGKVLTVDVNGGTDSSIQAAVNVSSPTESYSGSSSSGSYSGGSGTEADPYRISTCDDLIQLAGTSGDWDRYFVLTDDLSLSTSSPANPIGNSVNEFTGSFDGQDHTIRGFTMDKIGSSYIGLFGYLGIGAEIKYLRVEAGADDVNGENYVGVLVGYNEKGVITNCSATGDVTASGDYAGDLVGYNSGGTIDNCYATGSASASSDAAGGLVGYNSGSIENCYATGDATASATASSCYVGGLVGYNYYGTITNCYAAGDATTSYYAGGLVGWNYYSSIENCYATGDAKASMYHAGGLVGYNYGVTIENCYATGDAKASISCAGGLVGFNSGSGNGTIINCYATGNATAINSYAGGLAGKNYGTITNCYATGNATAIDSDAGGLVGNNSGAVKNCYRYSDTGDNQEGTLISDISKFKDYDFLTGTTSGDGLAWSTKIISTSTNSTKIWRVFAAKSSYPFFQWQVVQSGGSNENYSGGSGMDTDPYLISTCDDLIQLSGTSGDWDKYFVLTDDISLSAGSLTNPIGNSVTKFTGSFDGQSHTISGFTMDKIGSNYTGLFGYLGSGAEIKYLRVEAGAEDVSGENYVGVLVGYNEKGAIMNCSATGDIIASGDYAGDLVGYNYGGTIENCYAIGDASASYNGTGGLVGKNNGGIIENCYATGDATTSSYGAGGLVGYNSGGIIENCYATGNAIASINCAGSLVGSNSGSIDNCYATGSASASSDGAGGLVGYNSGSIENCYATGNAIASINCAGGLAGYNSGSIENCYAIGTASASSDGAGGLVGYNYGGTIDNCYATGEATASSYGAGGLVGKNFGGTIDNCYATGNATVSINNCAGGFAGYNNGSIDNCYATGNATASSYAAGGLVGYNDGSIDNCYATGNATASKYAGGLVGKNYGTIENCYRYSNTGDNQDGTLISDITKFKDYDFLTGTTSGDGLAWSTKIISTSADSTKIWMVFADKSSYPVFQWQSLEYVSQKSSDSSTGSSSGGGGGGGGGGGVASPYTFDEITVKELTQGYSSAGEPFKVTFSDERNPVTEAFFIPKVAGGRVYVTVTVLNGVPDSIGVTPNGKVFQVLDIDISKILGSKLESGNVTFKVTKEWLDSLGEGYTVTFQHFKDEKWINCPTEPSPDDPYTFIASIDSCSPFAITAVKAGEVYEEEDEGARIKMASEEQKEGNENSAEEAITEENGLSTTLKIGGILIGLVTLALIGVAISRNEKQKNRKE